MAAPATPTPAVAVALAPAPASAPSVASATVAPIPVTPSVVAPAVVLSTPAVSASVSVSVPTLIASPPSALKAGPPPQVLRGAVDAYMKEHKLYDQIRGLVAQQLATASPPPAAVPPPLSGDSKYAKPSDEVVQQQQLALAAQQQVSALTVIERDIVDNVLQKMLAGAVAATTAQATSPADTPAFAAAFPAQSFVPSAKPVAAVNPQRRHMSVRVFGAKAFVDHVTTAAFDPITSASGGAADQKALNTSSGDVGSGSAVNGPGGFVWVVACWGGLRFESRPVAAVVDPAIDCQFVFPLQSDADPELVPLPELLTRAPTAEPVELFVMRSVPLLGTSPPEHAHFQLVATHRVQWRQALAHGSHSQTVQLTSAADDLALPIGMLQVEVALHPLKLPANPKEVPVFVEPAAVTKQLNAERAHSNALSGKFLTYAKAWLLEYEQLSPAAHPSRFVKVFARSETGAIRSACSFVERLRAPRIVDSALHALRFVRLLEWRRASASSGGDSGVWCTPRAFLIRRSGDTIDHALLLCSLLLGLGLDAYVAVGTKDKHDGAYAWVVTRSSATQVLCWDGVTGQRHAVPTGAAASAASSQLLEATLPFRKLHCLFNDRNVWANAQRDDAVRTTDFAIENTKLWKPMNALVIAALAQSPAATAGATATAPAATATAAVPSPSPVPSIALLPNSTNLMATEQAIDSELRGLVRAYRTHRLRASTVFDEPFAYVLSPALCAYEHERVTGQTYGNSEFEQSVKRSIPAGYVFKGVPLQFNHAAATKMFAAALANPSATDALATRNGADDVRFGVVVRCFAYPEHVMAVWIMIAVSYAVVAEVDTVPAPSDRP